MVQCWKTPSRVPSHAVMHIWMVSPCQMGQCLMGIHPGRSRRLGLLWMYMPRLSISLPEAAKQLFLARSISADLGRTLPCRMGFIWRGPLSGRHISPKRLAR